MEDEFKYKLYRCRRCGKVFGEPMMVYDIVGEEVRIMRLCPFCGYDGYDEVKD